MGRPIVSPPFPSYEGTVVWSPVPHKRTDSRARAGRIRLVRAPLLTRLGGGIFATVAPNVGPGAAEKESGIHRLMLQVLRGHLGKGGVRKNQDRYGIGSFGGDHYRKYLI